ncbi:guanylate kinase [Pseudomethylobacillus aquaticus]|uniref:Guanylate kinase n=1 Tax=Pseudomethylobacillus aquaticus TaxID=2676064 RepID=A0A3N0V288_9PROT|nr:guanylate kinase [Pseudomethylobacillus aquaticus]ROH86825.1 guanylate kinase [Pseudomethylobacillus aquaticus]
MTANLFIISAASGAGKTSLVHALLQQDPAVRLSVSHTTRAPRPGEQEGVHYHFVNVTTFQRMQEEGDFIESAHVHGNRYGTSRSAVEAQLAAGFDVILEIDWQGAAQVRKLLPQAVSIFVLPPSLEELARRLNDRGQDSADVIAIRLAAAREEMRHVTEFDYVTINDSFAVALEDIQAIVRAQRLRSQAQLKQHAALIGTLV